MDSVSLSQNATRIVIDKTAFTGSDSAKVHVISGPRALLSLVVSAIDPATSVTISFQDTIDGDTYTELTTLARSTVGRTNLPVADYHSDLKLVVTVAGGNATFKLGMTTMELGNVEVTLGDVSIDVSSVATEATLIQVRDNLADLEGYVDELETLTASLGTISTGVASSVDGLEALNTSILAAVDGIEPLLTSIAGYVDQLEGFTDGIEGKLDTGNASTASIDTKLTSQATAAKQDTGNASLASIDGKTPALVSGRVPVDGSGVTQPVSGPLTDAQLRATPVPVSASSLPLPTGAATESTLASVLSAISAVGSNTDGIEGLIAATNALLTLLNGYVDGIEGQLTTLAGYLDGVEGLLTTGNSTLSSIDGHVDGLEASASSIDTKLTSQATAAKQDTGNASLDSIDDKSTNTAHLGYGPVSGFVDSFLGPLQEIFSDDYDGYAMAYVKIVATTLTGTGADVITVKFESRMDPALPWETTNIFEANAGGANFPGIYFFVRQGGTDYDLGAIRVPISARYMRASVWTYDPTNGTSSLTAYVTLAKRDETLADRLQSVRLLSYFGNELIGQQPMSNSIPVVIADDQTPIPVTATIDTTGLATDACDTSLASIDAKIPASPATTDKQDTGNTSLSSIDTKASTIIGHVDGIETLLTAIDGHVDGLEASASSIDTKLTSQATAAKQDTGNASVASIDTKMTTISGYLDGVETLLTAIDGHVDGLEASASSIDTKLTSQATAAKQDTGNTSLGSIDTKLTSQATAAKQDTGNTSVASIDTKMSTLIGHVDGVETLLTAIDGHVDGTEASLTSIDSKIPASPSTAGAQATGNATLTSIDGHVDGLEASASSIDTKLPSQGAALKVASLPVNIASDQVVPVSATSLPLPASASTDASVTNVQGSVTPGTVATKSSLAGGQYNATAPTLTDQQQAALQLDASGRVITALPTNAAKDNGQIAELLKELILETRAMRLAVVALAIDGGRSRAEDFDPNKTDFSSNN